MAKRGGARPQATLRYDEDVYTPIGAKSLTSAELRKEYSRLRSIARKRLQRFEGTEWTDSQVYLYNKDRYKPLSQVRNDTEVRHLLSDVARFITANRGSVSGLNRARARTIETLQDRGYDFINKSNFKEFTDFMEYARMYNINRLYDSEQIVELFEDALSRRESREELQQSFRKWLDRERERRVANINPRNSAMYRKDLD